MQTLTIILSRSNTPYEQIVLSLVQGKPNQEALQILHDLATQAGIQIVQITTTLTLTGKIQLKAELVGEANDAALVSGGDDAYRKGKIDFLTYQDTERSFKIRIFGTWMRTWL